MSFIIDVTCYAVERHGFIICTTQVGLIWAILCLSENIFFLATTIGT